MAGAPNKAPRGLTLLQRLGRWGEELTMGSAAGAAGRGCWWRTTSQFIAAVARDFFGNRCPVRAAALAYTTLLALVPLLAVAFSLATSVLHQSSDVVVPRLLDKALGLIAPALEYMPVEGGAPGAVVVSPAARQEAIAKIEQFINNIDAGKLGVVGSLLLVVVAIRLLMTIEDAFNEIWAVRQGRSIWRKIVYYWSTITLGPLLLTVAVAVTGTVEFSGLYGKLSFAPALEKLLLHLVPFVVLWVGFTMMYGLMPNTRVPARAAIIGGVIGGTLWQVNSLLSTLYVSRVVTYSKIYGSLGIIPMFLAGLYLSWFIVLLGAQVSFTVQTFHARRQQRRREPLDQAGCELLGCRLVLRVCESFLRGARPATVAASSDHLAAPLPVLNQLVERLTAAGILVETGDELPGLLPARPPDSLTVAEVLQALRTRADHRDRSAEGSGPDPVGAVLRELQATAAAAPANLSFKQLAMQASSLR